MIFEFSWSDYECYEPYLFEGEEKTWEEFKADCDKSLKESFDEYISNVDDTWAGLDEWMKYAIVKMEDYGYKRIVPVKFGYCGLALEKSDRYSPENDGQHEEEYKRDFPEFLDEIQRMRENNDVIDERLHHELYKQVEEEIDDDML